MGNISETQKKILEVGKAEFLKHGFKDASLTKICTQAGFTKGAFYGYYKDKASLFYELCDPVAGGFFENFKNAQSSFYLLIDKGETKESNAVSKDFLLSFLDYVYLNLDVFLLILCKSQGTKYETFVNDLVTLQVDTTLLYHEELKKIGKIQGDIDKNLFHIIISAYYESLFEIVRHDIKKEDAIIYIEKISTFFTAGYETMIKYT